MALILVQVCDGGYRENVMKKGEGECPALAEHEGPLLEKREKWGTRFLLSADSDARGAVLTVWRYGQRRKERAAHFLANCLPGVK